MTHHNNNLTIHNKRIPMKEHFIDHPDLTNKPNPAKGRNTLRIPYPTKYVKPAPKPYKLRPPKAQRAPNTPRKRKIHIHNSQEGSPLPLAAILQTQPTLKHCSAAQAPPRIDRVFPTPSVMPHRNPPKNTTKYMQTNHTRQKQLEPNPGDSHSARQIRNTNKTTYRYATIGKRQ
jgi:hypothetical protein